MDDVPVELDFSRAERRTFLAGADAAGKRVDVFLAPRLEDLSRSALQRLVRDGRVTVNGQPVRPATRLRDGDRIEVEVPDVRPLTLEPQDLPLFVLVDDPAFLVIDKAPGMAVHPGAGRVRGTVANAIAFRRGGLASSYRPGIVHRLDLETSGVLVVAKTDAAHAALAAAFKERRVFKEYRALVFGEPPFDEDRIDLPIGRDLNHPKRMTIRHDQGRAAQTDVTVLARFGSAAEVACRPRTGRTHQIRVHLEARGHPILGDRIYARRRKPPVAVPRLMLHALRLRFPHPLSGEPVEAVAPIPEDYAAVRSALT